MTIQFQTNLPSAPRPVNRLRISRPRLDPRAMRVEGQPESLGFRVPREFLHTNGSNPDLMGYGAR